MHYGIIGDGSVVRALLDSGVAQWLEHYVMVDCSSVDRALWDSGIAQRVEH